MLSPEDSPKSTPEKMDNQTNGDTSDDCFTEEIENGVEVTMNYILETIEHGFATSETDNNEDGKLPRKFVQRRMGLSSDDLKYLMGSSSKNEENSDGDNSNDANDQDDDNADTGGTSNQRVKTVKRKVYPCHVCGQSQFVSRRTVIKHIRKAHYEKYKEFLKNNFRGIVICKFVEKQIPVRAARKSRDSPTSDIDYIKCDQCDMECENSQDMKHHVEKFHQPLASKRTRKEPVKFQLESFRIRCEICGKTYESNKGYQQHMETHKTVNEVEDLPQTQTPDQRRRATSLLPCPICGLGLYSQDAFRRHINTHDPLPIGVKQAIFSGKKVVFKKCHYCQKPFFNYYQLNKHVQEEHEGFEPEVSIIYEAEKIPQQQFELPQRIQLPPGVVHHVQPQQPLQIQPKISRQIVQQQVRQLKLPPPLPQNNSNHRVITPVQGGKRIINKKCDHCNEFFHNYYQYHKHVKDVHQATPSMQFQKMLMNSSPSVVGKVKILRCSVCNGQYMNEIDFNKHKTISKPYKPVLCKICKLPCQHECAMMQHLLEMHPSVGNKRRNGTSNVVVPAKKGRFSFSDEQYVANQFNPDWSRYDTLTNPLSGPSYGIPPGLEVETKLDNDIQHTIDGIKIPKGLSISVQGGIKIPKGLEISLKDTTVKIPAGLQISVREEPVKIITPTVRVPVRPIKVGPQLKAVPSGQQVRMVSGTQIRAASQQKMRSAQQPPVKGPVKILPNKVGVGQVRIAPKQQQPKAVTSTKTIKDEVIIPDSLDD